MILEWQKSSYSAGDNCVEVAITPTTIYVRDSNNPTTIQRYTHDEWNAFIQGVKAGEFNKAPQ